MPHSALIPGRRQPGCPNRPYESEHYVFDLRYYDFALVGQAARQRVPFRHSAQIQYEAAGGRTPTIAAGGNVVSDRTGRLPERMAASRRNRSTTLVARSSSAPAPTAHCGCSPMI
jgi:hypothetical protein